MKKIGVILKVEITRLLNKYFSFNEALKGVKMARKSTLGNLILPFGLGKSIIESLGNLVICNI